MWTNRLLYRFITSDSRCTGLACTCTVPFKHVRVRHDNHEMPVSKATASSSSSLCRCYWALTHTPTLALVHVTASASDERLEQKLLHATGLHARSL